MIIDCSRSRKREKNCINRGSVSFCSFSSINIMKFSVCFKNSLSGFASSEAKLTLKSPIKIIGFLSSSDPEIAAASVVYSTKPLWMKVITAKTKLPGDI
ncbi:hypothetical protein TNCV_1555811 [Trichonephila clavipes]|nr:hypothetical protein TNCV_1555811 [Trichonephila clavipes]